MLIKLLDDIENNKKDRSTLTTRKDLVRKQIAKGERNIDIDSFDSSKYLKERYVNFCL